MHKKIMPNTVSTDLDLFPCVRVHCTFGFNGLKNCSPKTSLLNISCTMYAKRLEINSFTIEIESIVNCWYARAQNLLEARKNNFRAT